MPEALKPIVLVLADEPGEWPLFDGTDGREAVVYFTNKERARQFLEGRKFTAQLRPMVLPQPIFFDRLRHYLVNGVPVVVTDPGTEDEVAVEIFRFLAEFA
jgi:hypothetical protein